MATKEAKSAQYRSIIVHIFQKHWIEGVESFEFSREEMDEAAEALGIVRSENKGALIYQFKFRQELPLAIRQTAPTGKGWMLEVSLV